jgi:hypothetical protein
LLTWGTERFTTVPVEEHPHTLGKSNYNLMGLIALSLTLLTNYTTVPLRPTYQVLNIIGGETDRK